MDCIPYINDLMLEIQILEDVKANDNCDINLIDNKIKDKKMLIEKCKNNLSKLSENQICYRIYLKMLNGMTTNKAISKVAEENYLNGTSPSSERAIWKNYYPQLKKILNVQ